MKTHARMKPRQWSTTVARYAVGGLLAVPTVWMPQLALAQAPDAVPTPSTASLEAQTVERFALVIGSNATSSASQAPLRFADDDAARMAEVLAQAGVEVELLTRFDTESQARFPRLVPTAHPAELDEVRAALERLDARVKAAHAAGRRADLIVYYSGHGDVGPDGQGFLTLEGGKLTRRFLFDRIVGRSKADRKHLIVDACRSEELVAPRGQGWKPDRAASTYGKDVAEYLQRTELSGHPDTGVLIAASADQQTHEWERYQGGVFTHQVISGLRGAADLNGDGRVEYSELGAFVSSANSAVLDPRARLGVFVHAPETDQRAALLEHRDIAGQRTLLLVGQDARHYALEDARGVRLADLRRSGPNPTYVRLPDRGPVFVFRSPDPVDDASVADPRREEARIEDGRAGPIFAARLEFTPGQRRARGALDEAFRAGLFRVPYGLGYYAGYTDQTGMLGVEDPEWEVRVWKRVDGEMVEVARVSADPDAEGVAPKMLPPEEEPPPFEGPVEGDTVVTTVETETSARDAWRDHWGSIWGGFSFGTELNPFAPPGNIRFQPKRMIANDFRGLEGDPVMRGFDARWWGFSARDPRSYPRGEWYFRTGYTEGTADLGPRDESAGYQPSDASRLDYFTVPLFVGGNLYAFKRFPVRPFAGAGFGFDVLSLDYTRPDGSHRTDTSARIGFELHAGVDVRITNYVGIVGEVRQLWSARRKISRVPDFSNEGLTVVTALRFNLPLHRKDRDVRAGRERRKTTTTVTTRKIPAGKDEASQPPAPTPSSEFEGPATAPDEPGPGNDDQVQLGDALPPPAAASSAADAQGESRTKPSAAPPSRP